MLRPSRTGNAILVFICLLIIFPLFWMILTSIKPEKEIYTFPLTFFPKKITLGNYFYILFEVEMFLRYVTNSIVVTVVATLGVIAFGMMGGYPLGRMQFLLRGIIFGFLVLIMAVPWNIYLIPVYILESRLGLRNSWAGLFLPYIALRLPWALIILSGAFASVPKDLEETAILDGCRNFQVFSRILVPLVKPGMVAALLITFIFVWKEFMFAVTLNSDSYWQTLPVGIVFLKDELQTLAYGRVSAAIILSLIPIFFIFFPMRNIFFTGIKEGGFLKE